MFYIGPATFQVLSSCGYYGDHCHCSCGDRSQILLIREVGEACGKARRLGIDREKGSIKLLGVNPPSQLQLPFPGWDCGGDGASGEICARITLKLLRCFFPSKLSIAPHA